MVIAGQVAGRQYLTRREKRAIRRYLFAVALEPPQKAEKHLAHLHPSIADYLKTISELGDSLRRSAREGRFRETPVFLRFAYPSDFSDSHLPSIRWFLQVNADVALKRTAILLSASSLLFKKTRSDIRLDFKTARGVSQEIYWDARDICLMIESRSHALFRDLSLL